MDRNTFIIGDFCLTDDWPSEEEPLLVIDSFPIAVSKKSRSYRCKVVSELSDPCDARTTNGRSYRFSTGLLEGASELLRLERF